MNFADKLNARIKATGSRLCVGLDPRPEKIGGDVRTFLREVIEQCSPLAAAFKPNMAYFEALGAPGIEILETTLERIPDEVPVVLDAKRSDIGETQRYYARACFERWKADAVTLNPFLGYDTLEPFFEYEDRGVYLLAVTSNPGSKDVQMLKTGDRYVFEAVQDMALRAPAGSCGLVVGLTNARPEVLERIADLPLLVPGLGAQGGEVGALAGGERQSPILINVSRGVLYGDQGTYGSRAEAYVDRIAEVFSG